MENNEFYIQYLDFSLFIIIFYVLPIILTLIFIKKKNYTNLSKDQRYAGFWWRIFAGYIDLIITFTILALFYFLFDKEYLDIFFDESVESSESMFDYRFVRDTLLFALYFVLFQSSKHQATLGMKFCGIKIFDEQFNKAGFWRLTGRYFTTYLSFIILAVGFFMIAFTKKKQGLHDIVARTIHLKDKKKWSLGKKIFSIILLSPFLIICIASIAFFFLWIIGKG